MLRGSSVFYTHTGIVLFSVEAAAFYLSPSIKVEVPLHLQGHEMRPKLYAPAIESYAKPSVFVESFAMYHSFTMHVHLYAHISKYPYFRNKTFYAYSKAQLFI